ncbi:MAG: hypothetical protein WDO06_06460 [Actinomycetota bacterium]
MYAAIANGGKILQPIIGKEVVAPDGKVLKRFSSTVLGKLPRHSFNVKVFTRRSSRSCY